MMNFKNLPLHWSSSRSASPALLVAALLIPASAFGQLTATWDDIPDPPNPVTYAPTPLGYKGVNWFWGDGAFGDLATAKLLEYSTFTGTAVAPLPSGENAAYNAWGNAPMRIESLTTSATDAFTFSGWFSAQGYPDPNFSGSTGASKIRVEGFIFVAGSLEPAFITETFDITSSWVQRSFSSTPVNKLLFSPLDGSDNPSASFEGYFYLDDAMITPVPEPATWTLAGAVACGIFALIRRRRAS